MIAKSAILEIDRLIAAARRGPLTSNECIRLAGLVPLVPARRRAAVETLSAMHTSSAVDALIELGPMDTIALRGFAATLRAGVTRTATSGQAMPHMLALDFASNARPEFSPLVAQARVRFDDALHHYRTPDDTLRYRLALRTSDEGHALDDGQCRAIESMTGDALQAWARELNWLLPRLMRVTHTRVWVNGWSFADQGPLSASARLELIEAWISWALRRREVQRR